MLFGQKSLAYQKQLENLNKTYEDKTLFNAVYEISCEYYEEGITREMMRRFADHLSKLQYEENISDQELGEFIGASHSHVQKLRTIGVSKPTADKKTSDRKESSDSKKASPDKKNSEAKYPKYINQAYFVGICLRFGCSPNYLFGDTEDPEQFLYKRPRFISGDRSNKRTILERCPSAKQASGEPATANRIVISSPPSWRSGSPSGRESPTRQ